MKFLIVSLLCLSFSALAAPHAKVILVKGDVTYDGVKLTKNKMIDANGILNVGEKSVVRIKVDAYNSVMTFGPKSEMKVAFKKDEYEKSPYTLVSGGVRWVTQGKAKYKGGIQTKSTVMGIRGTDFLALTNPTLGESEIVCFDGKVLFENKEQSYNKHVVSKGQWGGIGGRYGKSIAKPLDLPMSVVEQMKKVVSID